MKLDAKFYGFIHKVKDDSVVPDDQWIVFLAKDDVFAAMFLDPVSGYEARCRNSDCDVEQITAVAAMSQRLRNWREANADICKPPDAAGEMLLV